MGPDDSVGRLFVAVALSDEVRHGLAAHLNDAVEGVLPGRATPPDNWHLTLRFLGETNTSEFEMVVHALATDLATQAPFTVSFSGLGAFPKPSKATVLWLGVDRGSDELTSLASMAQDAAASAGFGLEERPFHPHITLSRIRPHEDVTFLVDSIARFPLTQMVEQVVVYRSRLDAAPARYEVVDTVGLVS